MMLRHFPHLQVIISFDIIWSNRSKHLWHLSLCLQMPCNPHLLWISQHPKENYSRVLESVTWIWTAIILDTMSRMSFLFRCRSKSSLTLLLWFEQNCSSYSEVCTALDFHQENYHHYCHLIFHRLGSLPPQNNIKTVFAHPFLHALALKCVVVCQLFLAMLC